MHQSHLGVHALEPGVLLLHLAQLRQAGDAHARELALPLVVGRLADAVLAAGLADLGTELNLLEHVHDLAVGESRLHVETT